MNSDALMGAAKNYRRPREKERERAREKGLNEIIAARFVLIDCVPKVLIADWLIISTSSLTISESNKEHSLSL